MRIAMVVVALAMLSLVPSARPAMSHGFGGGGHFGHFGFHRYFPRYGRFGRFGRGLAYGGLIIAPSYAPDASIGYQAPPPPCQETVTVISESGGTRQITITRCGGQPN